MIRICPKCMSTDVSPEVSTRTIARGSFQNEYKCNDCGNEGIFFPEVDEKELKRLKKKK